MTEKKKKSLLGESIDLEFSGFQLLDKGFGFGDVKVEEKREEEHRKRDLGLLAKMRTELHGKTFQKNKTSLPIPLEKSESERQDQGDKEDKISLKEGRLPFLGNGKKMLPPPLLEEDRKLKKPKKAPIEAILSQQLKKIPPPKEEILAKAKLEKARKQIRKKSAPTSFSFLLLGHFFDLLVVISLLVSEVFLLGTFFKTEEIFLLDVVFRKFSLSNLTVFSVFEGISFLYLAYFLYYLLFSLFLGRSLGFFFLLKMRKNTQGKKA